MAYKVTCDHCRRGFQSEVTLIRHKLDEHPEAYVRRLPFDFVNEEWATECTVCGERSPDPRHIRSHKRLFK